MPMNPDDPRATPRDAAESEERELSEGVAADRGARERGARERAAADADDPREDEGWTQPESSAQKGAVRDEG